MPSAFGIVDLFAGPGGLGEGFASLVCDGTTPFRIGISVEKEASAHQTLTLRAFLRECRARSRISRTSRRACTSGGTGGAGEPVMARGYVVKAADSRHTAPGARGSAHDPFCPFDLSKIILHGR